MGKLAIFALGPLHIELDGQPIQTSRHKALALLVYLSMQAKKQTREALSAFLWPEYEQEKAYAYLRRTIWELHSLLGKGWLETDREEIGFNPAAILYLDIKRFQAHLEAIKDHNHPDTAVCSECISNLHKAALLYRDDFLAGFSLRDSINFDDWLFFQQEALRREYADALRKLVSLQLVKRSYIEAILLAQRWLALDSLNEDAHRQLIKAYALNGQRHVALRQYQECQRILQAEMGIDPEPATTALYEAIASGEYNPKDESLSQRTEILGQNATETTQTAGGLGKITPSQTARPASNLPIPSTKFIGRHQELNQIATLLSDSDCWLLTLLGAGGRGKTRLAIETAYNLINDFPQGVFFVPLSTIQAEQSIAPAIARGIGLTLQQNGPSPGEQLLDFLREKRLLIILDAFEGLVQWAAVLVQIHSHASGVKMLVTTRHRLCLQGEWVLEVKGLDFPQEPPQEGGYAAGEPSRAYSAVELFMQAACRTLVTFHAAPQDLAAIIQITRLLEGLPLSLELAATWVNILSCQEIADEIRRGLDILETSLGDIPEQQRSMRTVFDRSWNLLNNREQILLPRLAVFRGSFSRQVAEQVAGISLRELSGLVDKSLVRRTAQGWFDLHDLQRQYCVEKLARLPADDQETNHRHCVYFCARLSEWNRQMSGDRQGQALREVEAELEDIQAAWGWAIHQKRLEYIEQAVDGLVMFYFRQARLTEALNACQEAMDAVQAISLFEDHTQHARLSARLLTWQSTLCMNLERLDEAEQFLQEGQRILDDPQLDPLRINHERIFLLAIHALVANLQADIPAMLIYYEQAFQLSQNTNQKSPKLLIYFWRFLMGGSVSKELYQHMEKNLPVVKQCGDPFEIGCYLYVIGIAELYHFYRMEKAEPLLMESISSFQVVDDPTTQLLVTKTFGYLLSVQGKFDENLSLKLRDLEIVKNIGDRRMIGITLTEIGEVYCHQGKYFQAEEHIRTGMALVKDRSDYEYALRHRYLGDVLLAQGKYAEAQDAYLYSYNYFQTKNDKGWMLTALTGLSRAELALGDRSNAWSYANQALRLYSQVRLYTFFAYLTVAEIALLLADSGEVTCAFELYSLVLRQGYLSESRWFADLFGKFIEEVASHLSLEEQTAAKKRSEAFEFNDIISILLDNIETFS